MGVPQQDLREIQLGDGLAAFAKFVKLELENLLLQILHEALEVLVFQLVGSVFPEEVYHQGGVDRVSSLQPLR